MPRPLTVSEHADENRILDPRTSAEAGRWKTSRTPYLREPMDTFNDPVVRKVTIKFCTQVGKTEVALNILSFSIGEDPGTALFVKPTKEDAKEISADRVKRMIELSPALNCHVEDWETGKQKMNMLRYSLDRMFVYFGWSGSATSLAARAIRLLIRDEPDKFERWTGREGSPISLSEERLATYSDSFICDTGTPTTPDNHMEMEWADSLKKRYFVPCPHCGEFQWLRWPQIKFPPEVRDHKIMIRDKLAWYECEICKEKILDIHKPTMLARGRWLAFEHEKIIHLATIHPNDDPESVIPDDAAETFTIDNADSRWVYMTQGECPKLAHVGYHLNALYSPWTDKTFSHVAGEFLKSNGIPEKMMNFANSWLAEPWVERVEATDESKLRMHIAGYSKQSLPEKARVLTAAVDVQERLFYITIRAWGYRETTWLIDNFALPHNDPEDWENMAKVVEAYSAPFESPEYEPLTVLVAGIDSGYKTGQVYEFCWRHPLFKPMKGDVSVVAGVATTALEKYPHNNKKIPGGLMLWRFNPDFFKEKIHSSFKIGPNQPGAWAPVSPPSNNAYCAHSRKPHSMRRSDSALRWRIDFMPWATTTIRRPSRIAEPAMPKPDFLVCPVFNPSAPIFLNSSGFRLGCLILL